MAELLKNIYNSIYIEKLAAKLKKFHSSLNEKDFISSILSKDWPTLELKARTNRITETLYSYLPKEFSTATSILLQAAPEFGGYHGMFFPTYIERYGQNNFAASIKALEILTVYSSAEFAVRPFIQSHPEKMMKVMLIWSKHKNEHIRRLASEGCRPRLPWAMALPAFKKDPTLILPILENLKNDPSEYVRRSVANNLNDITKDNPKIVLEIASRWHGKNENTNRLLKHAMRTMLKKGEPKALKIFGLGKIKDLLLQQFKIETPKINKGQTLLFSFLIQIKSKSPQTVRIEYCLYFLKKNGTHNRKVFKISEAPINETKEFQKSHSMKDISTRKHHPGIHYVSLQINGIEQEKIEFLLIHNK